MSSHWSRVRYVVATLILVVAVLSASGCNDASTPDSGGPFIGNSETKKFHLPSCGHLPTVNRVSLPNCDAANSGGYSPCSYCEPSC
jgi:hypothetical protein